MNFRFILCLLSIVVLSESKREPKFAPYLDVTRDEEFSLVELKEKYGVKAFTLAFALGGKQDCSPTWAGQLPINDTGVIDKITAFRAAGGDIIVATGGANSPYLENSCSSVDGLVRAYRKVLSLCGSTHLDIDIEATINLDIMNQALATLQKENPALTVSYTLIVQGDDYGVNPTLGTIPLKNAAKHGVVVDIVNPMTMDFATAHEYGSAVIAAAEATHKQMKAIWPQKSEQELYSMLGATPMIGVNDNGKVYTTEHAKKLVKWAKQKKIGHLAFWSIGRDRPCPGKMVDPGCSSIAQEDYEFTKIFVDFDSDDKYDPFPTLEPTEGPTTQPTTRKPVTHEPMDCKEPNKHYTHESDCSKYYWCVAGRVVLESCGAGTIWDPSKNICNYPKDVNRPECKQLVE